MKFKLFIILLLLALSISVFEIGGIFAVIGVFSFGYAFYQLFAQDKNWIPIGDIALVIAGFQWIISPLMSYTITKSMFKMSQTCPEYMCITVPLYVCFILGFGLNRKKFLLTIEQVRDKCIKANKLSKLFIIIGLIAFLFPFNISALNQILKFISQLMYVGVLMKMIAFPNKSTFYLSSALLLTLLMSIIGGAMFHEFITWGVILVLIWFKIKEFNLTKKIAILIIGLLFVNSIQTIKVALRENVWYGKGEGNPIELFIDLMISSVGETEATGNDNFDNNSRYNQGWIISMIYNHIPASHDYFYGRTISDAIVTAVAPRFLIPDKKGSGEQARLDFTEMTGFYIQENTSMGLSVLGESYGNFGPVGGAIFMFFWGWFIALIINLANILAKKYSFIWLLMLPIICFMLIEAEISMITVLNWTIKGMIFSCIVVFLSKQYVRKL